MASRVLTRRLLHHRAPTIFAQSRSFRTNFTKQNNNITRYNFSSKNVSFLGPCSSSPRFFCADPKTETKNAEDTDSNVDNYDHVIPSGEFKEVYKADSIWEAKEASELRVTQALTAEAIGWGWGLAVFADSIHPALSALLIVISLTSIQMKYVFTQAGICGMAMRNVTEIQLLESNDKGEQGDIFVKIKTDMVERRLRLTSIDALSFDSEDRGKPILPEIVKNRGLMFAIKPNFINQSETGDRVITMEKEEWSRPWPSRMPKPGRLKDLTQETINQQKKMRDRFQAFANKDGDVDVPIVFNKLTMSVVRWAVVVNLTVAMGAMWQFSQNPDAMY